MVERGLVGVTEKRTAQTLWCAVKNYGFAADSGLAIAKSGFFGCVLDLQANEYMREQLLS